MINGIQVVNDTPHITIQQCFTPFLLGNTNFVHCNSLYTDGHIYENYICKVCGTRDGSCEHKNRVMKYTAPTCSDEGSQSMWCPDCNYETMDILEKIPHTPKDLSATGTADSATQHALFGTRPDKAGDTSDLSFAIYPAEKIDWFTGGIQEMLPRGAKFKIYDVKTGIVWWAYRQAGGKHMDIETLSAADSKRLCEIYGTQTLQEIVDRNMWYPRRACLVTIGTRTFACSLDGMQHGDDTISNNGMDGQVCLHFTNSQGHASGEVSTSHAEAIEYAYKNAPNGQKK